MTDKHEDYIELFLKLTGSGESLQTKTWLETNGFVDADDGEAFQRGSNFTSGH